MPNTFETFQLNKTLLHNLKGMGIQTPTSIQELAIPKLLEGKDLIAESQTGTGKTLAYALPILQKIDPSLKKLQALVLVPTRELGAQIHEVVQAVSNGSDIGCQLLIGGAAIQRQIDRLRLHPQIVVGTPGRILELIKVRKLSMHHVRTIVIDEADQVFEQGEGQEVETIIRSALRDRQLCFFSATLPEPIRRLADRWMSEPVHLQVQPEQKTAATLEHLYVLTDERERIDTVRRLIRTLEPQSGIIFTNQVDDFGEILGKLQYAGLSVEGLYSEAGKQERAKVMKDFREGKLQLLLATDVAARGIDIPNVTHVFHMDLPLDADHYVHRSGRTGRMGREGTVISICSSRQMFILEKFERALGIRFERKMLYEGRLLSPSELPKRTLHRKEAEEQRRSGAGRGLDQRSGNGSAPRIERGRKPDQESGELQRGSGTERRNGGFDGGNANSRGRTVGSTSDQARGQGTRSARKADQKNKGAPRWLKEKRGRE